MKILVRNRDSGETFEEKVYGEKAVSFFWGSPFGRLLLAPRSVQFFFSRFYGFKEDRKASRDKIPDFIEKYGIDLEQFEVPEGGFASFNDFFARKLKPTSYSFCKDDQHFSSPCEARLSVFPVENGDCSLFIKERPSTLTQLCTTRVEVPKRGWAWVFRLCPTDYHRFHFPDSGKVVKDFRIEGKLVSVNPLAMTQIEHVLFKNERHLTEFQSDHFGRILYLEVGAINVGKIVQTFDPLAVQRRGGEKGTFKFGASTVVLITGEGLSPDEDLIRSSEEGYESKVFLGEKIGFTA